MCQSVEELRLALRPTFEVIISQCHVIPCYGHLLLPNISATTTTATVPYSIYEKSHLKTNTILDLRSPLWINLKGQDLSIMEETWISAQTGQPSSLCTGKSSL